MLAVPTSRRRSVPPNLASRHALLASGASATGALTHGWIDTPAGSLRGFAIAAVVALAAIGLLAADGAPLRRLAMPVEGVRIADLHDTSDEGRPGAPRQAIDIAAPRGARVLAADDGTLVKLFTSVAGGLTVYQFDPDRHFAYSYARLDRYADGLREGMRLRRGDIIGYVGSSGNSPQEAPHLQFAVFRLGPEKAWWQGEAIDPLDAFH